MTTVGRRLVAIFVALSAVTASKSATAQEFRVFTVVYDLADSESGRPEVIARAATVFHAGKAYDYLDAANEVIVYEPTERQFRVLQPSKGIVATVAFDEIRHLLKIPREETERQAARLAGQGDPESRQAERLLRFQLDPRFQESFDEKSRSLSLDGEVLRYEAKLVDPGRPGVVEAYLEYADWVGRLNYLLHPGPVLPEPRLALNQAMRSKARLPETVEQHVAITPAIHRRAEHTVHFQLNAQDRSLISQWESQLKLGAAKQVSLQDYQRVMLAADAR